MLYRYCPVIERLWESVAFSGMTVTVIPLLLSSQSCLTLLHYNLLHRLSSYHTLPHPAFPCPNLAFSLPYVTYFISLATLCLPSQLSFPPCPSLTLPPYTLPPHTLPIISYPPYSPSFLSRLVVTIFPPLLISSPPYHLPSLS